MQPVVGAFPRAETAFPGEADLIELQLLAFVLGERRSEPVKVDVDETAQQIARTERQHRCGHPFRLQLPSAMVVVTER